MNKIVLLKILYIVSFITITADENCVNCETQLLMNGEVDADLNEEVCEYMEALDFEGILEIMAEEGLKFENVYVQFRCGKSIPQLMDYVTNNPYKHGNTVSHMLVYFDKVKENNPSFKYGSIINVTHTYVGVDGRKYVTTLLDRINVTLSELPQHMRERLERVKKSLISRGALTAEQLSMRD